MLVLQLRKARDFQRLAEQEKEGQAGAGAGYRGPDGSGQWVSMAELGSNDLDQVLGGLGGGEVFDRAVIVCQHDAVIYPVRHRSIECFFCSLTCTTRWH